MSPRTKLTEENILDRELITEAELNQFFGTVVITGTDDQTSTIQSFDQYFPGRDLVTGAGGVVVTTGSNFVRVSSSIPNAIVGGSGIAVASGTNTITITNTAGGGVANAIIGDSFISVISGTNTTRLTADAIIGVSKNITVISGTDIITVSGAMTVSSGIAYINDSTRGNKSLSVARANFAFGKNGATDNEFLEFGSTFNAASGAPLIRNGTIVSYSGYFVSGPNPKPFEVRKNNSTVTLSTINLTPGVHFFDDQINIDVDKGDRLQVFVGSAGGGARAPVFVIEVAWRLS